MNSILSSNKIYVATSHIANAGRGIFATVDIETGESIEICPAIVLSHEDMLIIEKTQLSNYYFWWGEDRSQVAIALGYGSLYNHSYEPNALYEKDFLNKEIRITAIKNIRENEEITVNYNGDPLSKNDLWIKSIPSYKTTSSPSQPE